jgi:electron transfer flavoprotein alpha subunit
MTVLLVAETRHGLLEEDATARALEAARSLGEIHLLVAGYDVGDAAQRGAALRGVGRVLVADHEALRHLGAEVMEQLLLVAAHGYSHVIAPSTSSSRNFLPRFAAKVDAMVVTDVMAIRSEDTFDRPIYAGNGLQTVTSNDDIRVLSVRTAGFRPAPFDQGPCPVVAVEWTAGSVRAKWLGDGGGASGRPDLSSAEIVVSGGRGVGSADGFALVERLADALGAAVGASRAAVDSGYAPGDLQVGQTGKVVAPKLYVAVGISGAIQHIAGMKDSGVVVAINNDEEAPIVHLADVVLIADLFSALPELIAQLHAPNLPPSL